MRIMLLVLFALVLAACAANEPPGQSQPQPPPETRARELQADLLARRVPAVAAAPALQAYASMQERLSTYPGLDRFPDKEPGGTLNVAEHPVSTFSVDVDTASYAFVRRHLNSGRLPPREAVRVEEMVNYFPYAYAAPADRAQPFLVSASLLPCPWDADNRLLHVTVRGFDIARNARPRANVVLLIDTSGSMAPGDRLPLLQQGFRLFAEQLRADDRVAIVTYAGQAQVALEPTAGADKHRIVEVIDNLRAAGSTAGADGLQRAYALAERHFDAAAVNRVILATDGDFNVGISDPRELERFIAAKRKTGIYLSIFGVGIGNLNDALMQRLAQAGNGNAAYIDSLLEARKAMAEELASTMFPIANDVKIQVEFNPASVVSYRLIGYETRMLRREDFNDDKVDAGDIGAGHTVTALYEITPAGAAKRRVDPLRYQSERGAPAAGAPAGELAFVRLRYKRPGEQASRLIEQPVRAAAATAGAPSADQRFAVAVAAFAQRIRGEPAVQQMAYADIAALAGAARGSDPEGYRAEFVRLVRMAESLEKTAMR
jgi:Ca-activated chloride channel family protein